MVFGMTVVYLFLWLMIVVVKQSSRFVVKFDYLIPDDPKPKRRAVQAPAASSTTAATDKVATGGVVAVIG
jgi:Na+-transporting methylmalonyl-CoA/oxaloacetate decarboxylase gamma subunit